jgi:hypothetical protein
MNTTKKHTETAVGANVEVGLEVNADKNYIYVDTSIQYKIMI